MHEDERGGDQREHNPVEWRAALKLERFRSQIELNQEADARPGDGRNAREDAQDLSEGQGDESKIRALEPGAEA